MRLNTIIVEKKTITSKIASSQQYHKTMISLSKLFANDW